MNEDQPQNLESIFDAMLESSDGEETTSVDDLLKAFGSRSFGPLLVVPAALMVSPIGGIPGAPAVFNTFIILICVQHIFGKKHPWLPSMLRERAVSRDKLERAVEKVRPGAKRVDRLLAPRLTFLTTPPMDRVLALIATLLAVSIFAVSLIPFASAVPSAGIVLIGLAVATRDGLLALLSAVFIAGTVWLGVSAFG